MVSISFPLEHTPGRDTHFGCVSNTEYFVELRSVNKYITRYHGYKTMDRLAMKWSVLTTCHRSHSASLVPFAHRHPPTSLPTRSRPPKTSLRVSSRGPTWSHDRKTGTFAVTPVREVWHSVPNCMIRIVTPRVVSNQTTWSAGTIVQ